MDWNGILWDVLIEQCFEIDEQTGFRLPSKKYDIVVWADDGLDDLIATIDGVLDIYTPIARKYMVQIDKRFDKKFVTEEIRRVLLCRPDLLKTTPKLIDNSGPILSLGTGTTNYELGDDAGNGSSDTEDGSDDDEMGMMD